jgi:hypothetical protein
VQALRSLLLGGFLENFYAIFSFFSLRTVQKLCDTLRTQYNAYEVWLGLELHSATQFVWLLQCNACYSMLHCISCMLQCTTEATRDNIFCSQKEFFLMAMSSSTPRDNPYLAHLPPAMRGTSSPASSSAKAKEPLYGFIPRKVKAPQVLAAMVRCSLLSRHYSPGSNILHANI